ncbi:MAG: hypothetical protein M5U19_09355 [Microthrixaceae bacterium]|nr:hypothetical protein [Microthrixaceae bacterium]
MIDLRGTTPDHSDETVSGRRCGFPVPPARPAAVLNTRCLRIALDPGTGEYRLSIG